MPVIDRAGVGEDVRVRIGSGPRRCAPLLLLGAGASKAFGVPTMPEFLTEQDWRQMDARNTAGALAVRRSLELTKLVDLEELMYLLEKLASMERGDAIAAPFLGAFTTKNSAIARVFEFDRIRGDAIEEREILRRLIYEKCNGFDRQSAWDVYSRLLSSLRAFSGGRTIWVATTNYDRIVEGLWANPTQGFQSFSPRFELQTGFYPQPYANPILDASRGYPEAGEDADCVVRLVKIHGSLGWREYEPGRVEETRAREYPGQAAVLAYPLREDKSSHRIFSQLYAAFDRGLTESNFIVLVGISLRDEAVVGRLTEALREGRKRALVVDPAAEEVKSKLPPEVRKYVGTLPGLLGQDIRLESEAEWQAAYQRASIGPGCQAGD